jgi:hypothetical protein
MNGLIKSAKLERNNSVALLQNKHDAGSTASDAPSVPVQLDLLAEEVVGSVLAGYGYMHMADNTGGTPEEQGSSTHRSGWQLARGDGSPSDYAPGQQHSADPEAVQLFLDIEPAESWSFLMHPGAFRRIVMNLFGNSLKFTKAGSIRVHMRQEPSGKPGFGRIFLEVADTGKGISDEYLRNQLYTPFAQEDHFAPGTGLGLSLVRQVVTGLGGEIDVTSKLGRGTTVSVSLPLPIGGEAWKDEEETSLMAAARELAGLRVLLQGSNKHASTTEETHAGLGNGAQHEEAKSQLQLIESTCRGWLKMEVVSSHSPAPDFIISTDEKFSSLEIGDGGVDPLACPHIYVCRSSRVVTSITSQRRLPDFFDVLSQPIGPRKLIKSLHDSRRRWLEAQRAPPPKPSTAAEPAKEKPLLVSTPSQVGELTAVLQAVGLIETSSQAAVSPDTKGEAETRVGPATVESASAVPESPITAKQIQHRGTVLIVDDNPINRKVCAFSSQQYMARN